MQTARTVSLVLVLALVAAACGDDSSSDDPTTGGAAASTTAPPGSTSTTVGSAPEGEPASVDITLDNDSATTATLGPAGGSVTATGPDGTTFTLAVPEGALLSPIEITMTPIASATGDAMGDAFGSGVELQPDGLQFLEFVELTIAGPSVDETSVAWSAQGGEDFHLVPGSASPGSITIATSHFTDFGDARDDIGSFLEATLPAGLRERVEHGVAQFESARTIDALRRWMDYLREEIAVPDVDTFDGWTANIESAFLEAGRSAETFDWTADTSGFDEVVAAMQALLDRWFTEADAFVTGFGNDCVQGDISGFFDILRVAFIGIDMVNEVGVPERPIFDTWTGLAGQCLQLGVTWQANVITTGPDDGFFSDISFGALYEFEAMGTEAVAIALGGVDPQGSHVLADEEADVPLEVEYIDGFWEGLSCSPTPGTATLAPVIAWEMPNLGDISDATITRIEVGVWISVDIVLECGAAGITADAQKAFHGGAMRMLNESRLRDGLWHFEVESDPGGGMLGQKQEGPQNLPFTYADDQGVEHPANYELWQLLTVYQRTPAG
jgi:hypothetical protein